MANASDDLLAAIDELGKTPWSGTLYRHTAIDRSDPLSGEGARIAGGRWNPPDSFATVYLAGSIEGCIAELRRMAVAIGREPRDLLPRALHVVEAHDLSLLDLTADAALAAVGLTLDDVRSDDRQQCQIVGEGAYFLNLQGVFAPSATGEGTVQAAFPARLTLGQLEVVETTTLPHIS